MGLCCHSGSAVFSVFLTDAGTSPVPLLCACFLQKGAYSLMVTILV